jgi:hypothetical protein
LQIGSLRILERNVSSGGVLNLPQRRSLVKAINAESQRNDSIVPLAATIVAPGAFNCLMFMKRVFMVILVIWLNEVD